jgi:hypothetical protein
MAADGTGEERARLLHKDATSTPEDGRGTLRPVREVRLSSDILKGMHVYWDKLRNTRVFPARADIDPVDIKPFLGRIVLFDVLKDPLRFKFRLVGLEFVNQFGLDPTGKMVDEYPRPESRQFIADMLTSTLAAREPMTIRRTVLTGDRVCNYESLYMPLSADGENIDMIMFGFEAR